MPVKREPVDAPDTAAAAAEASASLPKPASINTNSSGNEDDDDDGAIDIIDVDAADGRLGATKVLTSGAEAPPALTRDYAAAFFNTDPRISFDALHIGALRCIEARENISWSTSAYQAWMVPQTDYMDASSSPSRKPFFTVPAMHPFVQSRTPIEREDIKVDALLYQPSRATLTAAIGPDLLQRLRLHRSTSDYNRKRRASRSASAAWRKERGKGRHAKTEDT